MIRRPLVLLLQLPIPPPGPLPVRGNVPLAPAYLKLWARRRGLEEHLDIEVLDAGIANLVGDRALVDLIAELRPWLVGFTCYLWNVDRSLWVASRLRELSPSTTIVVGGPEITRDNCWVLSSGAIDFAVVGEGEETFAELLEALLREDGGMEGIAGLARREGGVLTLSRPRAPLRDLDAISSPYLEGILDAGDSDALLLETVRGCIFRCKFCYYPKAYDALHFLSSEKILENLTHARERGAREVFILDPTLNQRRDFADFLRVLARGNPQQSLAFHGEARAEGLRPEHAALLGQAGFEEVEIGLQSLDPAAQKLMHRRGSLKAFEVGVRALRAEGVRAKVDLIVGLPGDTMDSIRAGMRYLADGRLHDAIQVFQLSVLPGTAFREEAAQLGLLYQDRPPYYVLRTRELGIEQIVALQAEAEEIFGVEFDETFPVLGPAALEETLLRPPGCAAVPVRCGLVVDLDAAGGTPPALPRWPAQAFTLWLRAREIYGRLRTAAELVRSLLRENPFTTLQVVIETEADFPFNVFFALREAATRTVSSYLDRFYEFTPRRNAGSLRFVVLFPVSRRSAVPADWVEDALAHADIVWREVGSFSAAPRPIERLEATDRSGEWVAPPRPPIE